MRNLLILLGFITLMGCSEPYRALLLKCELNEDFLLIEVFDGGERYHYYERIKSFKFNKNRNVDIKTKLGFTYHYKAVEGVQCKILRD